jgi:hypothetical protein
MWIFRKLKLSRQLKSTSSSERFKAAVELAEAGQEMAIPSLASFFEDSENNFLATVRLKDLAANRGSESAIQAIIRAADSKNQETCPGWSAMPRWKYRNMPVRANGCWRSPANGSPELWWAS